MAMGQCLGQATRRPVGVLEPSGGSRAGIVQRAVGAWQAGLCFVDMASFGFADAGAVEQGQQDPLEAASPSNVGVKTNDVVDDQYAAWVGRFTEAFKFISTAYTELMKEGVPELGRMRDVQARSMQFY